MTHQIDLDRITPEQAIQGTVEMWTDMKDALGDTPTAKQRYAFKRDWLVKHDYVSVLFPYSMTSVSSDCFLCECALAQWSHAGFRNGYCDYCPICWPDDGQFAPKCISNTLNYISAPISVILAHIQNEKYRRYK